MSLERNAAGEVFREAPASPALGPGLNAPPSTVHRFKVFFPTSSFSNPPPLAQRQQMAHLLVPLRGPLTEISLQTFCDQVVDRISKRYPRITDEYTVEGFDVIPIVWESNTSAAATAQRESLASSAASGKGTNGSGGQWMADVYSAYRLDIAMNGLDELDFYFAMPHTGESGTPSAPPYELVISWRGKNAPSPLQTAGNLGGTAFAPNQQALQFPPPTPPMMVGRKTRVGSGGGRRLTPIINPMPLFATNGQGGALGSFAIAMSGPASGGQSPVTRPAGTELPPLVPAPRPGTPSRGAPSNLPPLEPKRPNDGNARYRQTNTPSPAVSSSGDLIAVIRNGSKEELGSFTGSPNKPNGADISGTLGNSANRGRRSVQTTFAVADPTDAPIASSSRPISSQQAQRTVSPYTDSEVNPEEFVSFQLQMITLTECEDRDTIILQEPMERAILTKQWLQIQQAAMIANSAEASTMKPAAAAAVHHGSGALSLADKPAHSIGLGSNADDNFSLRGTSVSPPSVRSTLQHEDIANTTVATSTITEHSVAASCHEPFDEGNGAQRPVRRSFTVEPRSHDNSVNDQQPRPQAPATVTAPAAPSTSAVAYTTSSSSAAAAALFAIAPTSAIVAEALRNHELYDPDDGDEEDEQLALRCDELLNDWFMIRQQVLTDERKSFRVITQELKALQRNGALSMTACIRDEALALALKYSGATASGGRVASPRGQERSTYAPVASSPVHSSAIGSSPKKADEAGSVLLPQPPSSDAPVVSKPYHRASVDSVKQGEVTTAGSTSPSKPTATSSKSAAVIAAADLERISTFVNLIEVGTRRDVAAEEAEAWLQVKENILIDRRRITLRAEQQLLALERQLKEDERRLRNEIADIEVRKFEMFAGLCQKGIQRIRSSVPIRPAEFPSSRDSTRSGTNDDAKWEEL